MASLKFIEFLVFTIALIFSYKLICVAFVQASFTADYNCNSDGYITIPGPVDHANDAEFLKEFFSDLEYYKKVPYTEQPESSPNRNSPSLSSSNESINSQDSSDGLPPDEIQKVLEEFYELDREDLIRVIIQLRRKIEQFEVINDNLQLKLDTKIDQIDYLTEHNNSLKLKYNKLQTKFDTLKTSTVVNHVSETPQQDRSPINSTDFSFSNSSVFNNTDSKLHKSKRVSFNLKKGATNSTNSIIPTHYLETNAKITSLSEPGIDRHINTVESGTRYNNKNQSNSMESEKPNQELSPFYQQLISLPIGTSSPVVGVQKSNPSDSLHSEDSIEKKISFSKDNDSPLFNEKIGLSTQQVNKESRINYTDAIFQFLDLTTNAIKDLQAQNQTLIEETRQISTAYPWLEHSDNEFNELKLKYNSLVARFRSGNSKFQTALKVIEEHRQLVNNFIIDEEEKEKLKLENKELIEKRDYFEKETAKLVLELEELEFYRDFLKRIKEDRAQCPYDHGLNQEQKFLYEQSLEVSEMLTQQNQKLLSENEEFRKGFDSLQMILRYFKDHPKALAEHINAAKIKHESDAVIEKLKKDFHTQFAKAKENSDRQFEIMTQENRKLRDNAQKFQKAYGLYYTQYAAQTQFLGKVIKKANSAFSQIKDLMDHDAQLYNFASTLSKEYKTLHQNFEHMSLNMNVADPARSD